MKKITYYSICLLVLLAFAFNIAGCAGRSATAEFGEEKPTASSIYVYSLNFERDYISRLVREFPAVEDINGLVVQQMMEANKDLFPKNTKLLSVTIDGSAATVDFSKEISEIDQETFLFINELCAISLAQGVTAQGNKISTITLLAEGQPIEGFYQYPYQAHLVDYTDQENLKVEVLKLFYPDKQGEKLHPEYRLVSMIDDLDKTMIYELFYGTGDYANKTNVIPVGTRLLDISCTGNTYIVNLNSAFIDNRQDESTTNMLAIQSIVATLSEFTVIDQVKFNVEGKTSGVTFGDIALDQPIALKEELIANE